MQQITEDQLDTFLDKHGLAYNVGMKPVINPFTMQEETKTFCSYRTDTNEIFKYGLSKGFHPIQNRDAFRVISDMSGVADLSMESGGSFRGGAGVFAQISLGDMEVGGHDDKVGKFLTIINSHDGSKGMRIMITPYRYFCSNQIAGSIARAAKEKVQGLNTSMSIRHTASAGHRLDELADTIKIIDGQFEETAELYNNLANQKINNAYTQEVIQRMFPLNPEAGKRGRTIWTNTTQKVWERFHNADAGRVEVNTAWNLYNAVQGTIQHSGRDSAQKHQSVLTGAISKRSAEALATVMEVCSSEHIPQSTLAEISEITGG